MFPRGCPEQTVSDGRRGRTVPHPDAGAVALQGNAVGDGVEQLHGELCGGRWVRVSQPRPNLVSTGASVSTHGCFDAAR